MANWDIASPSQLRHILTILDTLEDELLEACGELDERLPSDPLYHIEKIRRAARAELEIREQSLRFKLTRVA